MDGSHLLKLILRLKWNWNSRLRDPSPSLRAKSIEVMLSCDLPEREELRWMMWCLFGGVHARRIGDDGGTVQEQEKWNGPCRRIVPDSSQHVRT